jgi:hypothetical protein
MLFAKLTAVHDRSPRRPLPMMLVTDSDTRFDSDTLEGHEQDASVDAVSARLSIRPKTHSSPGNRSADQANDSGPSHDDANIWPAEVDLILSALEAGRANSLPDRRGTAREPYRVRASLRLFSDLEDAAPWILFTRDVDTRGVGFITRHRLPLGYGGVIRLTLPDGRELEASCTLLRCRQAAPGWYEGALYFNRAQQVP